METRERRKPRIKSREWTATDKALLRKYIDEGYDTIQTARKLDRSREDVTMMVEELGLNLDYEPDPLELPKTPRLCLSCRREFIHRSNRICPDCKERVEFRSSASDTLALNLQYHKRGR